MKLEPRLIGGQGADGRRMHYPRGKTMGGSSARNL